MNIILAVFGVIFSILTMLFAFLVHPLGWVISGITTGVVAAMKGFGLVSIVLAICAVPVTLLVGLVGGAACVWLTAITVKNIK